MGSISDHIRENILPNSDLNINDRLISFFSRTFLGNGSPEGVIAAPVGSTFLRRDGGASTTMYVKESGAGNTGWVAYGAGGGGGGAEPSALTHISSVTLGADAASIDFAAIPGTHKDLVIPFVIRSVATGGTERLAVRFNDDSAGNYKLQRISSGSATVSGANLGAQTSVLAGSMADADGAAGDATHGEIVIPFYADTTFDKGVLINMWSARSSGIYSLVAAHWNNTAAITKVSLLGSSANFLAGSRASLYGRS